jgi:acyl-CoA dehydrogenase
VKRWHRQWRSSETRPLDLLGTAASYVLDRAIQVHGGAGVSSDTPLAEAWAQVRTLHLADGPDEVHLRTLARQELRRRSGV